MEIIFTNFDYVYPLKKLDKTKVRWLILHHGAAVEASAEAIHRWHLEKDFGGFGYNEYIRKDGRVFIGRGGNIGAHCKNQNAISYGICLEGNYQEERTMPKEQMNSLIERIRVARENYPFIQGIKKHGDFGNTSCPGKFFPFERIIRELDRENIHPAIEYLASKGIIGDREYWNRKSRYGELVQGEYAEILIQRMAKYLKEQKGE